LIDEFEPFAPGLKDSVIGTWAKGPAELSRTVHKGHVIHTDISLAQMGPFRPTPSLAGYKTPVAGLWHAGAGAHPIGLINGWSGRTTARLVAKQLAKQPPAQVFVPPRGDKFPERMRSLTSV
jgi:beta-carotene ketolase (CrtO type)